MCGFSHIPPRFSSLQFRKATCLLSCSIDFQCYFLHTEVRLSGIQITFEDFVVVTSQHAPGRELCVLLWQPNMHQGCELCALTRSRDGLSPQPDRSRCHCLRNCALSHAARNRNVSVSQRSVGRLSGWTTAMSIKRITWPKEKSILTLLNLTRAPRLSTYTPVVTF